jgi:hypothetical protein
MALIVMSSVVISAVGTSSLILSSLQQTRTLDSAIVAFYAAESAAEEAVFDSRRTGDLPDAEGSPQPLTNTASWTRAVTDREDVIYAGTIPRDSFIEVALFDPDQETTATDIASVDVTWTDQCAGCTVLRTTMIGWRPGGPIAWDPLDPAKVGIATFNHTGGTASVSTGADNKLYRLRLLARQGDLENVQVRAKDGSAQPTTLPGRVKIDAVGSYGGVEQRLTVTLPRQTPLSGVYDFVVFSECSLVKAGVASCP